MSPEDLAVRLDELLKEVRRQGRAAIAAQASADACLDAIGAIREGQQGDTSREDDDGDDSLVEALLPLADSLERIVAAASAEASLEEAPLSWRERLLGRSRPRGSLVEPLRLLSAQLENALDAAGVTVDRRVGVPIDGDAHRVVEIAEQGRAAIGPSVVVSVVRPGYSRNGRCLREADVVASAAPSPLPLPRT